MIKCGLGLVAFLRSNSASGVFCCVTHSTAEEIRRRRERGEKKEEKKDEEEEQEKEGEGRRRKEEEGEGGEEKKPLSPVAGISNTPQCLPCCSHPSFPALHLRFSVDCLMNFIEGNVLRLAQRCIFQWSALIA